MKKVKPVVSSKTSEPPSKKLVEKILKKKKKDLTIELPLEEKQTPKIPDNSSPSLKKVDKSEPKGKPDDALSGKRAEPENPYKLERGDCPPDKRVVVSVVLNQHPEKTMSDTIEFVQKWFSFYHPMLRAEIVKNSGANVDPNSPISRGVAGKNDRGSALLPDLLQDRVTEENKTYKGRLRVQEEHLTVLQAILKPSVYEKLTAWIDITNTKDPEGKEHVVPLAKDMLERVLRRAARKVEGAAG